MEQFTKVLASILLLTAIVAIDARANLSDYLFSVGSGSEAANMAGATTLWLGSDNSVGGGTTDQVQTVSIGFPFKLEGVTYTQASISTNGVIGLGSTSVTNSGTNDLAAANVPILAPWWDQLRVHGGSGCFTESIAYVTSGTAPNRVFVVYYSNISIVPVQSDGANYGQFQVRLYETSNKIEFWYGIMSPCGCASKKAACYTTSASIGIANGSSNLVSVSPSGSAATFTLGKANNSININSQEKGSTSVASGTVYTFAPCTVEMTGNTAEGGTSGMNNGDILLSTKSVQRGSSGAFKPFSVAVKSCATRTYAFAITGTNAADYQIDIKSGTVDQKGPATPTITFSPSGPGVRTATIRVTDDNGFDRSYTLAGTASPRVTWTGNVSQGGTVALANGDVLLGNAKVLRNTLKTFQPITLTNANTNPAVPSAPITYSIDSAGFASTQFSITPGSASLLANQGSTPTITFKAFGVGAQTATLTVNAEGDIRKFTLSAFSSAAGAEFITATVNGPIGPTSALLLNTSACIGESAAWQAITVNSTGDIPLLINSIDFYRVDTVIRQGGPKYPLIRDAQQRLVPMVDYVITDVPGMAPLSANVRPALPISVAGGTSRTLYVSFVGQYPGRRNAYAVIRTNALNFLGSDTNLVGAGSPAPQVEGLLSFYVFGNGLGSSLAGDSLGAKLSPIFFPILRVGDTAKTTFSIANTGGCSMRISRDKLRIFSGDVKEFKIVSAFNNVATVDPLTNDYVLPAGAVDSVTISFIPTRGGTRLATLMLKTNDSTIQMHGLTERGTYYLDLTGRGKAGLDAGSLVLDPVLIGTSVTGTTTLENTSTGAVELSTIYFAGQDSAQFSENPAMPWPARPVTVLPGEKLTLGVRLTPTGTFGSRRTMLALTTSTGETITVPIIGEAGTQTLSVTPASLFDKVAIAVGQQVRENVMITNNGSLPVRVQSLKITGVDSLNYEMGLTPRLDIAPGGTAYLEITFAPKTPGQLSATLEIMSNATNGTQTVALGGTALRAGRQNDDPTTTIFTGTNVEVSAQQPATMRSSSVGGDMTLGGVKLSQSRPNPASGMAEIGYELNRRADATLELYDAQGRLVATLARGAHEAGRHVVRVDASALESGTYHYRLTVEGASLNGTMNVVR